MCALVGRTKEVSKSHCASRAERERGVNCHFVFSLLSLLCACALGGPLSLAADAIYTEYILVQWGIENVRYLFRFTSDAEKSDDDDDDKSKKKKERERLIGEAVAKA